MDQIDPTYPYSFPKTNKQPMQWLENWLLKTIGMGKIFYPSGPLPHTPTSKIVLDYWNFYMFTKPLSPLGSQYSACHIVNENYSNILFSFQGDCFSSGIPVPRWVPLPPTCCLRVLECCRKCLQMWAFPRVLLQYWFHKQPINKQGTSTLPLSVIVQVVP